MVLQRIATVIQLDFKHYYLVVRPWCVVVYLSLSCTRSDADRT
jgi:hypothetical protein